MTDDEARKAFEKLSFEEERKSGSSNWPDHWTAEQIYLAAWKARDTEVHKLDAVLRYFMLAWSEPNTERSMHQLKQDMDAAYAKAEHLIGKP